MIVEALSFMDQIEVLVACSQEEDDPHTILNAAISVMAEALVKSIPLDEIRLQQLAIRCGLAVRTGTFKRLLGAGRFVSAVIRYVERHEVALMDGRVATTSGWKTNDLPPDDEFENAAW
jgi:hypothetical protein